MVALNATATGMTPVLHKTNFNVEQGKQALTHSKGQAAPFSYPLLIPSSLTPFLPPFFPLVLLRKVHGFHKPTTTTMLLQGRPAEAAREP